MCILARTANPFLDRIELFQFEVAVPSSKGREAHLNRAELLLVQEKPPLQPIEGPPHCTTSDYVAAAGMVLGGETENT